MYLLPKIIAITCKAGVLEWRPVILVLIKCYLDFSDILFYSSWSQWGRYGCDLLVLRIPQEYKRTFWISK